ncbi:MAG: glucose-1-phosphate adenylyltransferase [Spirochaetes bacterium]|jgi:glucose-1-phosphate adenylyltransferase|nr:glucose-1-phosphate adenylyltransferase [Spirochaetota bacterium]
MARVLSIVMGGGKGTRLYPLTMERAKPAVPFGGKYRLVDIPLSNSINAGFVRIYVLTQFNSASLHLHIASTYIFDSFSKGFVELLAAEQTFDHSGWYEGTADAVRKNFPHFRTQEPTHYMILSGDQLYRMDLQDFFQRHLDSGADVTVAATPVNREQAEGFGILQADRKGRVQSFVEKPPIPDNIDHLRIPKELHPDETQRAAGKEYLASMGIYCFNAEAMDKALDNSLTDFGKEVIPSLIDSAEVSAYVFTGFWEDIGTVRSFYETNLNLAVFKPDFNFYEEDSPIYTHRRDLPASKFNSCTLKEVLAADGSIITDSAISRSIVGIRSVVEAGCTLDGVVLMGADFYEPEDRKAGNAARGVPSIGIGRNCRVAGAIIDKNARIGEDCRIGIDRQHYEDGDFPTHFVRDGVIVIPKGAVVPAGTVI